MSDPFAPIAAGAKQAAAAKPKGSNIVPVPADAPPPPAEHPTLGKPSAIWRYTDAGGRLLGFACRFDGAGGKQFRPLTFWRPPSGAPCWRWESWPEKRPLYGLQKLAERPRAPVLICEGEKAADAAAQLLLDFVTVTSPNGSKSARKADWSPLRARQIVIWPDADAAGIQYMRAVAQLVERRCRRVCGLDQGSRARCDGEGREAAGRLRGGMGRCRRVARRMDDRARRRADRRGGATGRDCRR